MMTEFTPMLSVSGGILIGLSAAAVFIFFGRILGISGTVARTLVHVKAHEKNSNSLR